VLPSLDFSKCRQERILLFCSDFFRLMAGRLASEDSDEEFQEIQYGKLQNNYRHAREDQREYTIEKKDQLRMQR
jgi:hypothetical protein